MAFDVAEILQKDPEVILQIDQKTAVSLENSARTRGLSTEDLVAKTLIVSCVKIRRK